MKKLMIFLIEVYQAYISVIIKSIVGVRDCCRFSPSCSEYCREAVERNGVLRGSIAGLKRLLSCQPFYG